MCMACTLSHRGERLRDVYRAGKKVGTAPSGGNGFWEGLKARVFGRSEAVRKGGGGLRRRGGKLVQRSVGMARSGCWWAVGELWRMRGSCGG